MLFEILFGGSSPSDVRMSESTKAVKERLRAHVVLVEVSDATHERQHAAEGYYNVPVPPSDVDFA
jgi:hypothetical protein